MNKAVPSDKVLVPQLQPGQDEKYMARALKLAEKGLYSTHPNPMVGCVIVHNSEIVGEGWHEFAGGPHAEVVALKQAGSRAKNATLYITLEPCNHQGRTKPCTDAIIKKGIKRVVVATEDPNPLVNRAGISALQQAKIDVTLGVGKQRAREVNKTFFKRVLTGVPWVVLKTATSLDGKTAMQDGESQWITSAEARADGQKLRAQSSAILTGVGTILRDDPKLNVRLPSTKRQPVRIVLDSNLSAPAEAKVFQSEGSVLLVTGQESTYLTNPNTEVFVCRKISGRIDLESMLQELGKREINSVLLEAGPRLCGSMLAQGLVDEVVLYMSADVMGSNTREMFNISGIERLADKINLVFKDVVKIGRDLKVTLQLAKS